MSAPNGLVVDWGGVLTTSVEESFDAWIVDEGVDRATFLAALRTGHDQPGSPLHQLERGALTPAEFECWLAGSLTTASGSAVSADGLLQRMFARVRPNDSMHAVVTRAREAGWRTAVLSNSWGIDFDGSDLNSLVDSVLLSEFFGWRKPDAAAYEAAATALRILPQLCLFADDLHRNVVGARNAGMRAIRYQPGVEPTLLSMVLGAALEGTP